MKKLFLHIAAAVPKLTLANPKNNEIEILKIINDANKKNIDIIIFPELSICGVTCADLFLNNTLITSCENSINNILKETKSIDILIFIGTPWVQYGKLYNSILALKNGKILSIINKIPELKEKRWFEIPNINIYNTAFEIDNTYIGVVKDNNLNFNININPWSYSSEKNNLINNEITKNKALIKVNSGSFESSTDFVFFGESYIYEDGNLIANETAFFESTLIHRHIDIEFNKKTNISFENIVKVDIPTKKIEDIFIKTNKTPFIPNNDTNLEKILNIQSIALARRLLHTNVKKAIVGISGGVDSTLALIATVNAFKYLKKDTKNILAITMPGMGTTTKTNKNAKELADNLKVSLKEISIVESIKTHFKDINHNGKPDLAYENAQARERTQILMDIANMEDGLVIGTGGMSEIALGFATYNGDHMSMYNVNSGIPKTLIVELLKYVSKKEENISEVLQNILNTPISPELLPNKNDEIEQKTEEVVGSYLLNDFFLYHFLKNKSSEKIIILARINFPEISKKELKQKLKNFYKRFFNAQYKRSCSVDGPKVLEFSLSPRGSFAMPSDAYASTWEEELDNLK
ncbi:MAG: NAD(+) synthase [Defluviitaleaceae bacterium]|nr:NAD(+) synthase [Defluviitaleaceae bacterium]